MRSPRRAFSKALAKGTEELARNCQAFRKFSLKGSQRDLFSQAFHHSFNAAVLHSQSLDRKYAQMRILGLNLMLVNVFIFRISGFYLEFGCYRVCIFCLF